MAVGQSVTGTATPLLTLPARDGVPDWNQIAGLIEQWQPDALVVGMPLQLDGTHSEITEAAQRFARRLEGRYKLPVHLMDERLSSFEAETALAEEQRRGARTQEIDAVAAQVILQNWLDLHGGYQ